MSTPYSFPEGWQIPSFSLVGCRAMAGTIAELDPNEPHRWEAGSMSIFITLLVIWIFRKPLREDARDLVRWIFRN
jgi:hypothetical protein